MKQTAYTLFSGSLATFSRGIAPKVDKFTYSYLYAAKLSNGLIKIGVTADPVTHFATLSRTLDPNKIHIEQVYLTVEHANFKDTKAEIFSSCADMKQDGDFFKADLEIIVDKIKQLHFKLEPTQKEKEKVREQEQACYDFFNAIHNIPK